MSNPGVYVPGVYVPGQQQQQQQQNASRAQAHVPSIFVPPGETQATQQGTYHATNNNNYNSPAYSSTPASSVHASCTQPYSATTTKPPSWASASAPHQYVPTPNPPQPSTGATTSPSYPQERANNSGSSASGKVTDDDMKVEFNMIDVDKRGFIDSNDFKRVFGSLVPRSLIDKAIAMVDKNSDKKISFDEYKAMRAQFGAVKIPKLK